MSTLKECTQLETLRFNFITYVHIPDHAETLLHAAYNDVLNANVEIILSAPSQLQTIILTWFHSGGLDARTVHALRNLPAWSRLDDAIRRLRHLASVTCVISLNEEWTIEETQIACEVLPVGSAGRIYRTERRRVASQDLGSRTSSHLCFRWPAYLQNPLMGAG